MTSPTPAAAAWDAYVVEKRILARLEAEKTTDEQSLSTQRDRTTAAFRVFNDAYRALDEEKASA